MSTKIVLITGKAQAGKSTAVQHILYQLQNKMNGSLVGKEYFFADPLKRFLVEVMGLRPEQCYGSNDDKNSLTHISWSSLPLPTEQIEELVKKSKRLSRDQYMTAREVMEVFGTQICRKMYHDCWAVWCRNEIVKQTKQIGTHIALISDVRFPNELEVFKDLNPLVVRLYRNPVNRDTDTERALDDYDFSKFDTVKLHNEGSTIEQKNTWIDEFVLPKLGVPFNG